MNYSIYQKSEKEIKDEKQDYDLGAACLFETKQRLGCLPYIYY